MNNSQRHGSFLFRPEHITTDLKESSDARRPEEHNINLSFAEIQLETTAKHPVADEGHALEKKPQFDLASTDHRPAQGRREGGK